MMRKSMLVLVVVGCFSRFQQGGACIVSVHVVSFEKWRPFRSGAGPSEMHSFCALWKKKNRLLLPQPTELCIHLPSESAAILYSRGFPPQLITSSPLYFSLFSELDLGSGASSFKCIAAPAIVLKVANRYVQAYFEKFQKPNQSVKGPLGLHVPQAVALDNKTMHNNKIKMQQMQLKRKTTTKSNGDCHHNQLYLFISTSRYSK